MMSLRLRLIGWIAAVLAASLVLGGTIACITAARSVETEMRSALAVAQRQAATVIGDLAGSESEPAQIRRELDRLVRSFRGNRHLHVFLAGDAASAADPAVEEAVPDWFVGLIGVVPEAAHLPVVVGGVERDTVEIVTDPRNEILETWRQFGDGLLVLGLFVGPTLLLIYLIIGRGLRPLERLASGLEAVGRGHYEARFGGPLPRELAVLRDSFNDMARQLAAIDAENRHLHRRLLTLREEERGDFARDLHDEVGPFLFAISIDAAAIAAAAEQGRGAAIQDHVRSITEAVTHMQRQVRTMLGRLRPVELPEGGLGEAIGGLIEFWRRRCPDIDYRMAVAPGSAALGPPLDATIYRIVQECLSNAVRHGRPATITVTVGVDAAGAATVEVADDGEGTADAASGAGATGGGGFGLAGMADRVAMLDGRVEFLGRPAGGVTVRASFPALAERPGRGARDA